MNAKYLYDELSKLTEEERTVTEVVYSLSVFDWAPIQGYVQKPAKNVDMRNASYFGFSKPPDSVDIPGYVFIWIPKEWIEEREAAIAAQSKQPQTLEPEWEYDDETYE